MTSVDAMQMDWVFLTSTVGIQQTVVYMQTDKPETSKQLEISSWTYNPPVSIVIFHDYSVETHDTPHTNQLIHLPFYSHPFFYFSNEHIEVILTEILLVFHATCCNKINYLSEILPVACATLYNILTSIQLISVQYITCKILPTLWWQ